MSEAPGEMPKESAGETPDEVRRERPPSALRPVPARWFELLTARDDLTLALETLARTGSVELEVHSELTTRMHLPDLHGYLEEFHRLAQRFHPFWPPREALHPSDVPQQPARTMSISLARLRAWAAEAEPLVLQLERLHSEENNLALWQEMLEGVGGWVLRLDLLAEAGPALGAGVWILPPRSRVSEIPAGVITTQVATHSHLFLLAVGPPEEMNELEEILSVLKGRRLRPPTVLQGEVSASLQAIESRRNAIAGEEQQLHQQFQTLEQSHGLREALGNILRLEWLLTHVETLPVSENFAWITGWTSDLSGARLETALAKAQVRGMLRFPPPPREREPPLVLHNPRWAQPFELFTTLLGTPGRDEADPSRLLSLVVPLLFGYMFGDVGQGAVLLLVGLALRGRFPTLRLLIPAGFSSIIFGLLFGSFFAREGFVAPLWFAPLEQPLQTLVIPLFAGMVLLLTGMTLAALEAAWRGQSATWWRREAAVVLLYLSVVASLFYPQAVLGGAAALLWYVVGCVIECWGELKRLPGEFGVLLEKSLQLLVNTLSFARVGAFALAHTGLAAAVAALADAAGKLPVELLIMVVGNLLIIALEGLVVSIQITRLVLFEFFIRFLSGEGRRFRPLEAPRRGVTEEQRPRSP